MTHRSLHSVPVLLTLASLLLVMPGQASAQNLFTDAARVAPGVEPCPDDFLQVEGCYNLELPPRPSLSRSAVRPDLPNAPETGLDSQRSKPFSGRTQIPGQTYILPPHRTSLDGRIASWAPSWNNPAVVALSPENVDYGLQTHSDAERHVQSRQAFLSNAIQFDPRPGKSRLPASEVGNDGQLRARGRFWDFCSGAGPEATHSPRSCTATLTAGAAPIEGDCYDQTPIWANVTPNNRWELRSVELVLFVPRGKTVRSASDSFPSGSDQHEILIYPKSVISDPQVLPPFEDYSYSKQVAWVGPGTWDYDWSFARFKSQALADCPITGSGEPWCALLDSQRALVTEDYRFFDAPGSSAPWNGQGAGHSFLEPATTADGRVIVIHDDSFGIVYAYNHSHGPCDARGFREFKPISMAYLDPDVNTRYGFARYPIRNTRGGTFAPGAPVRGGYPWIDRRGGNIIFPVATGQDGFKGTWLDDGTPITNQEVNRANSRATVVVGAWTRGKMIVLDNGLNPSDWHFSEWEHLHRTFSVPLYSDAEKWIRPGGISLVSSIENQLNHYEAFSPVLPFDVVWPASSSAQRNAEIVFDEYLHPGARIIAHMNAPLRPGMRDASYHNGNPTHLTPDTYDDNGFVSLSDNGYDFAFAGSPRLQNAATAPGVPATLELLGGAFVQPVAEGGVLGKGVFLDGRNDHIRAEGLSDLSSFYIGIWVDLRPENPTGPRGLDPGEQALFTFADGSVLSLAGAQLRARTGGQLRTVWLPGLLPERYSHFGFAVQTLGGRRLVRVYLDGTFVGSISFSGGFRTYVAPDWSSIDTSNPCAGSSSGAWTCSNTSAYAALCVNGQTITTSACFLAGEVCNGAPGMPATLVGGAPCVTPSWPVTYPGASSELVVGTPADAAHGLPPVRAWVDELRLYELGHGEALRPHFTEYACNLALGSMARIQSAKGHRPRLVCQQLDFRHDEQLDASGVGAGLDLAVEAYQTRNCASTVHGNAGDTCARRQLLGLDDKELVAQQPRPDFSALPFCQTCHDDPDDPVPGLRPEALLAGSVPASVDARRQPLQWPRLAPGELPELDGQLVLPFHPGWLSRNLDELILGDSAEEAPTKIPPQP